MEREQGMPEGEKCQGRLSWEDSLRGNISAEFILEEGKNSCTLVDFQWRMGTWLVVMSLSRRLSIVAQIRKSGW